ncbi:MAG: winged helix-turn-helix domain-containing protein [Candidatus Altiarchaeota archaeon]
MQANSIEEDIVELIKSNEGICTAEIAEFLGRSPTTVSKYLMVAHSKGMVDLEEKKPYKFWRIKK